MDKSIKLVIFAHARSGSSSLYRLLQLHPSLHIAEEPFHDSYQAWNPDEKNYVDHITDIASLEEQLGVLFAKYNGIKILQYQLPAELYTHLLRKPEVRIVFLRRRNLLQAAVSGRIAEQTKVWKIWDLAGDITQTYQQLAPLSIPSLREVIEYDDKSMTLYEQIVDRRPPGSYVKLWYEDLYMPDVAHNRSVLQRAFDLLKLSMPATPEVDYLLDPVLTKLNPAKLYKFIPNATEIDEQLGSGKTGWLFEKPPQVSSLSG